MFGRFAPSPSGDLHLGNLRTALVAWLIARSTQRGFLIRIEDLDRDRTVPGTAERHLSDLSALGLIWDGEVVRQSDRLDLYDESIARLVASGNTYDCFCTRREIREASSAPQGLQNGRYPGTCRDLSAAERQRWLDSGRPPALRLRAEAQQLAIHDALHPGYVGLVDDVVLRRNDGAPAYNLAVVVDDAAQLVDQVVRGDDLLTSTASQAHLAGLLGWSAPSYVHVPLVLNRTGERLSKRDGAVTLHDLAATGVGPDQVLCQLAASLGLASPGESVAAVQLLDRFDLGALALEPWIFSDERSS